MENESSGIINAFEGIGIVGVLIGELELESECYSGHEVRLKASNEGATLFCFGNAILTEKMASDG